jgi:2-keto-4-pentenoate hydratase/2-oxohepta-3-ene-1,7-dioic acid hydratase in catechol pathway
VRLARLRENGRLAVVNPDGTFAETTGHDLVFALENPDALEPTGRVLPPETPLAAPLPRPNRILAIGRNYAEHAAELGNAVPDEPVVFLKASTSVIGPGEAIAYPGWIGRVDYEAELLVILGTGGNVIGFTCFNDVTAREKSKTLQSKGHPWFLAKSRDTFGPMGPWVVSADAFGDPNEAQVRLSVNGELRQDGSARQMLNAIPALLEFLTQWVTLESGDVIATGTPPGVGPLQPGDIVRVEIPGIGVLENPVKTVS